MKRQIVYFPDAALSRVCAEIATFDQTLRDLADDLYDTLRAAPGVGITAAHVGVGLRLVVLDLPELGGRRTYVNPEVTWHSPDLMSHSEGSISMPGATETVTRPASIRVRYQDLDGQLIEERMEAFAAICMQHEVDQLDGMFWLKRLSKLKRDRLVRKWQKSQRQDD
ncbi:peptide deformylase [Agrobacterium sp. a22-2]|uniref:peptide deformylase n=1 Tax=Agrobacterium sp. a22-2 TaxID=2283840 RepID=UPI00144797C0|nr:peptide deformylase [Agrobacterium sp. a22-2]NKN38961.1 peptide deformylase [Agrobacterium sp. a22-2]